MPINVTTHYDRRKVAKESEGHLMISIKAEDKNHKRTPVCTVLCLDTSGSMNEFSGGQAKIEILKNTCRKIIENLTEDDQIAIIGFATGSRVILERRKVLNKAELFDTINRLIATGNTNMSSGILESIHQVDEGFKGVKRLMVLTDGQANTGISDTPGLVKMCKERDSSCSISTFGFGLSANQDLLKKVSDECGGNYYYIPDGNDVGVVFARELGGITSCMAQNITLEITPGKNEVLELLNEFRNEKTDKKFTIFVDDIYAGETKHILVRMKVVDERVAKVHLSFDHLKKSKRITDDYDIKVDIVKAEDADKDPILLVQEQVAILKAAKAQLQAVVYANAGNFTLAQSVLRGASEGLKWCIGEGSSYCSSADSALQGSMAMFSSSNYTPDFANVVHNSASNATKMRGGAVSYSCCRGVGGDAGSVGLQGFVGLSDVYTTDAAKDMEANFDDKKKAKKKKDGKK